MKPATTRFQCRWLNSVCCLPCAGSPVPGDNQPPNPGLDAQKPPGSSRYESSQAPRADRAFRPEPEERQASARDGPSPQGRDRQPARPEALASNIFKDSLLEESASPERAGPQTWSVPTLGEQPQGERAFFQARPAPVAEAGGRASPSPGPSPGAGVERRQASAYRQLLDRRRNNPRISPPGGTGEPEPARFAESASAKSRSFPYFDIDEQQYDRDARGDDLRLDR